MLDYINKDPIFPDSKYELYGDFEPPFYHYSKGLGFEEIERMIKADMFDEFGQVQFAQGHKYTLPPYLKNKFNFISKKQYYPDSVYDWAELHKINNLEKAQENRNMVLECSLVQAKVARGKPKLNLLKCEKNESLDRANRFIGFQDYQDLDFLLGLV